MREREREKEIGTSCLLEACSIQYPALLLMLGVYGSLDTHFRRSLHLTGCWHRSREICQLLFNLGSQHRITRALINYLSSVVARHLD